MSTTLSIGKAINEGLRAAMLLDPKVLIMGEDVGTLGGVFRVTDGLLGEFGAQRVIDTPLGEAGIVGTAIGLAMRGYRPVCEIQFDGFVFPAFDQIATQLAKTYARTGGRLSLPIVIRIPYGGGIGAVEHHSESPEAYFVHTPGLKVVTCSNPTDGHWMVRQAIASDDPVVLFEPKRRYWETASVDLDASPEMAHPLHASRTVRDGEDVTIVAYGPTVTTALRAAQTLDQDVPRRSAEVVDLRSLSPMDLDPVYASVRRTGRLVVVHEAQGTCGLGAEIAARVTDACFYSLEAPVARVTGYDIPYPPARVEQAHLPDVDRVLEAVDRTFAW